MGGRSLHHGPVARVRRRGAHRHRRATSRSRAISGSPTASFPRRPRCTRASASCGRGSTSSAVRARWTRRIPRCAASVLLTGKLTPQQILERIRADGHSRILCEGGPGLFEQAAGLIDELFLTLARLAGRFAGDARKSLAEARRLDGTALRLLWHSATATSLPALLHALTPPRAAYAAREPEDSLLPVFMLVMRVGYVRVLVCVQRVVMVRMRMRLDWSLPAHAGDERRGRARAHDRWTRASEGARAGRARTATRRAPSAPRRRPLRADNRRAAESTAPRRRRAPPRTAPPAAPHQARAARAGRGRRLAP